MINNDPNTTRGSSLNFCYVLTSGGSGSDALCEMVYISASLLVRLYPDCQVTILADETTLRHIEPLSFHFDEIGSSVRLQIVPTDPVYQTGAERSRYLKTRMRTLISGDFVYLDADALPLSPFHEIFDCGADFAAALDRNCNFPEPGFPEWVVPIYDRYGWEHPTLNYYNSGVMFMADTPAMNKLSTTWHQRWRQVLDELGFHEDQPTLNYTLHDLGIRQEVLPLAYNAMVDASPYYSRGAKILHYYLRGATRQAPPFSLLQHLVRHLKETDEIDWQVVEAASVRCDAWIHPTNSIHIELATRRYFSALGIAAARSLQRLMLSREE